MIVTPYAYSILCSRWRKVGFETKACRQSGKNLRQVYDVIVEGADVTQNS
jgi:hypothetical protein